MPRPSDVRTGPRFEPTGRPDATVTRRRLRIEVWLSSPTVAPGEWVQVAVRTTNLGPDTAWQMSGECLLSGTSVTAELRGTIPEGEAQSGNAAAFKTRITEWSTDEWFPPWRYRSELDAYTPVECTILPGPLDLGPGESRLEHFAWYAAWNLGGGRFWQPPFPGTVPVTVAWPFLGRGEKPPPVPRHYGRVLPRITVTAPLTISGAGPGAPSLDELVDRALADPGWRAWVDAGPVREHGGMIDWILWPGPDYAVIIGELDAYGHPDGILHLELARRGSGPVGRRGIILLDPWTGEVLDTFLPTYGMNGPQGTPMLSPSLRWKPR